MWCRNCSRSSGEIVLTPGAINVLTMFFSADPGCCEGGCHAQYCLKALLSVLWIFKCLFMLLPSLVHTWGGWAGRHPSLLAIWIQMLWCFWTFSKVFLCIPLYHVGRLLNKNTVLNLLSWQNPVALKAGGFQQLEVSSQIMQCASSSFVPFCPHLELTHVTVVSPFLFPTRQGHFGSQWPVKL